MNSHWDDTIAALASAPGPGERGIIRVSGPDLRAVFESLFQPDDPQCWRDSKTAARHLGRLLLKGLRCPLEAAVYLWPTRRSYTGEPMAEIHTLSSPPLLELILSELHRHGARSARPGEFTLRAFLAGRIDLMQAEAVLGVIDAHDQQELQTALQQLAGGLSGRIGQLRNDLLDLLADLEAGLDFVEEDIEFVPRSEFVRRIAAARNFVESLRQQSESRMHTSTRRRVVLAGLPNAGKSTLFNSLVGRDAALISEQEGTTRDYLVAAWDCDGLPVELIDTPGWDAGADQIMQLAQHYRDEQLDRADLVVWCTAADLDAEGRSLDKRLQNELHIEPAHLLYLRTKADRPTCDTPVAGAVEEDLSVSAVSGFGLDRLISAVKQRLTAPLAGERQLLGMTASRCRESLESAAIALAQAEQAANDRWAGDEILAVELRDALEHLGRVVGAVYTDDLLDRIFSKFCIGK